MWDLWWIKVSVRVLRCFPVSVIPSVRQSPSYQTPFTLSSGQRLELTRRKTQCSVFIPSLWCVAMYAFGVRLKSKLQHTGTWSVAEWPPLLSPNIILLPPFYCACFPASKKKIGAFKKILIFHFLTSLNIA